MSRALLSSFAAFGIMAAPASAQSAACADLRAQISSNNIAMVGVAADYPRTHVALGTCLSQSPTREEGRACAAMALASACIGMGSADCSDLMSRWERITLDQRYLNGRMRALGCRS